LLTIFKIQKLVWGETRKKGKYVPRGLGGLVGAGAVDARR